MCMCITEFYICNKHHPIKKNIKKIISWSQLYRCHSCIVVTIISLSQLYHCHNYIIVLSQCIVALTKMELPDIDNSNINKMIFKIIIHCTCMSSLYLTLKYNIIIMI